MKDTSWLDLIGVVVCFAIIIILATYVEIF